MTNYIAFLQYATFFLVKGKKQGFEKKDKIMENCLGHGTIWPFTTYIQPAGQYKSSINYTVTYFFLPVLMFRMFTWRYKELIHCYKVCCKLLLYGKLPIYSIFLHFILNIVLLLSVSSASEHLGCLPGNRKQHTLYQQFIMFSWNTNYNTIHRWLQKCWKNHTLNYILHILLYTHSGWSRINHIP